MIFDFFDKHKEAGLLLLRLGLGAIFIYHGLPKMTGGPQSWESLGAAMANYGITFLPAFWGFMAAFSELVGGMCLLVGVFFRPACFLLVFTMATAALMHLAAGDGLLRASHAIEDGIVFLSLIFIGPGKYSIDTKVKHYLSRRKPA